MQPPSQISLGKLTTPRLGPMAFGGVRGRGGRVPVPADADGIRAELHDDPGRGQPGADREDHEHADDRKGISYQLQNSGTALGVESGQTSQARVALATAGLLGVGSTQPGFELLNSSQLGASNFQQQITSQRALEGQLDQAIEQIQGVDSALVQLVIPNQQHSCSRDNSQTRHGLRPPGRLGHARPGVGEGDRRARRLERPGAVDQKVTITDPTGSLLWPTGRRRGRRRRRPPSSRPTSRTTRDGGRADAA